jgi:hypothetical protein
MKPYAWRKHTGEHREDVFYFTDTATGHSCTDHAAENPNRSTTTIVFWEDEDHDE